MRTDLSVVLTKVRSTHSNLNGNCFTGWTNARPSIGSRFYMVTGVDEMLGTTPIKAIRFTSENEVEFDTKNSTYKLQYVKDQVGIGDEVSLTPLQVELMALCLQYGVSSNLAVVAVVKDLESKLCGKASL